MSKKCADCGCEVNRNVIQGMYYCPRCDDDKREIDVLPMTLFDRITASPEVLAEKLVYQIYDCDGYEWWTSTLCNYTQWELKSEAIAATVARLNEVCVEQNAVDDTQARLSKVDDTQKEVAE